MPVVSLLKTRKNEQLKEEIQGQRRSNYRTRKEFNGKEFNGKESRPSRGSSVRSSCTRVRGPEISVRERSTGLTKSHEVKLSKQEIREKTKGAEGREAPPQASQARLQKHRLSGRAAEEAQVQTEEPRPSAPGLTPCHPFWRGQPETYF